MAGEKNERRRDLMSAVAVAASSSTRSAEMDRSSHSGSRFDSRTQRPPSLTEIDANLVRFRTTERVATQKNAHTATHSEHSHGPLNL